MFKSFALEWLQTCVIGSDLSESQIESDVSVVQNHLLPFFGEHALEDIGPRFIDSYKALKRVQAHQYGVGYAAKTINNHLSTLHRIFEKAIEYEILAKNPVTKRAWLKRQRAPEDFQNYWTPDEERRAIQTLETWRQAHPERRFCILLQLLTGIRFSELRALQKRDVELQVPGIWIRRALPRKNVGPPKNKRARFQLMPRALAEELDEWLSYIDGSNDLLFVGQKGGPLSNNCLNRWYRQLAEEAGVRRISSHGARHTSGSSYAMMGVGQQLIATLLGHKDVGTTQRYTHVNAVSATQPLVEERWRRLSGMQMGC